jgi:hypothetical protein
MRTSSIFILITSAIVTIVALSAMTFGRTVITADPVDDLVDYYQVTVNGENITIRPEIFNMSFLYELDHLKDGDHEMVIKSVSHLSGSSPEIKFYLNKKTVKRWITYTIKKDPSQIGNTEYDSKFGDVQKIKIRNVNYEIELINELQMKINLLEKGDFDLDQDTDASDLAHFNKYFGKTHEIQ